MKSKKMLSGFLSALMLVNVCGTNSFISHAADTNAVQEITTENESFELSEAVEKVNSLIESKENYSFANVMDILHESEGNYYEILAGLSSDTRAQFLEKLSKEEVYQFGLYSKYAFVKEMMEYKDKEELKESDMEVLGSYADLYAAIVEKQNEEAVSVDQISKLDEEVCETLVSKLDEEAAKDVKDLTTYAEYLQTLTNLDVMKVLEELNTFTCTNPDNLVKTTKEFQSFIYATYGFDELIEDVEEIENVTETSENDSNTQTKAAPAIVVERIGGKKVRIKVDNASTEDYQFKYVWQTNSWAEWGVIKDFSTDTSVEFTVPKNGTYTFIVDAKDINTGAKVSSNFSMTFDDTKYVARVGTNYYTTLSSAVSAAPSDATVYIIEDIELGTNESVLIEKPMTIMPDGGNRVISRSSSDTKSYYSILKLKTKGHVVLCGNDNYTLTLDGKNITYGTGLITTHADRLGNTESPAWNQTDYPATLDVKDGVILQNTLENGLYYGNGGTVNIDGAIIRNIQDKGVALENNGTTFNMYSGSIINCKIKGVNVTSGCKFNMYDGVISNNIIKKGFGYTNTSGQWVSADGNGIVWVSPTGTFNMYGGNLYDNSTQNGGAIYNEGVTKISGGIFENNTAFREGSSIYSVGDATITNGKFIENHVNNKNGAVANYGTMTISDSRFDGNTSDNDGAAIGNFGSLKVTGTVFENNVSDDLGGAVYQGPGGSAIFNSCTFKNNSFKESTNIDAEHRQSGGAISADGYLEVNDTDITGNVAHRAGALAMNDGSELVLKNSNITNNVADTMFGGAIGSYDAVISISDSRINNNSATLQGGAIDYTAGATGNTLNITDTEINGNKSDTNGGGISFKYNKEVVDTSYLSMKGCNVFGNLASEGGALYNLGQATLEASKFNENNAVTGGAIYQNGILNIKGNTDIKVNETNNDVYLPDDTKFINITGDLTSTTEKVARITPNDYYLGRKLVEVNYDNKVASDYFERFTLTPKDEFAIRPGDYIAE